MDRIDSFVIHAKEIKGHRDFTFILLEDDIPTEEHDIIIDYIDHLTRTLNKKYPQYKFTWQEAHKITPNTLTEEIIWQHNIQARSN